MTRRAETDLYPAIKAFWEERGYEVKAEIASADVVAVRPNDDPVVTELKLGFSLTLLQQAIARQAATRHVYVAVPKWSGRSGWRAFKGNLGLCRRLELGVLVVDFSDGSVKEYATPKPFERRINTKRSKRLKSDFDRRIGDPNMGGSQPQNILTNHRQRAEICAAYLLQHGPSQGAQVAKQTNIPEATRIMRDNYYGWFERVTRGTYALTPTGQAAASKV